MVHLPIRKEAWRLLLSLVLERALGRSASTFVRRARARLHEANPLCGTCSAAVADQLVWDPADQMPDPGPVDVSRLAPQTTSDSVAKAQHGWYLYLLCPGSPRLQKNFLPVQGQAPAFHAIRDPLHFSSRLRGGYLDAT